MKGLWVGVLGFLAGICAVCLIVMLYLRFGSLPVAVNDKPFLLEKQIVHVPLHAKIEREKTAFVPIQPTADNLLAGARIYHEHCAFCHGAPDSPSSLAKNMYPRVPQLWESHRKGIVGVSDDPVSETYWKVKNGIRLTGMPSYESILSDQQLWQVSMLLSQADKAKSPELMAALQP